MDKKLKCGLYVRCSTADQNTAMQLLELQEYAKNRGWVIHKIYEDKKTGTNTNRPMFQEMLRDAKAKRFDIVAIWKLDRFARSLKDLVTNLNELTEVGVALFSLKDQIDLTTSTGRLMLHILGAFGQFEADIIKERVTAGVRAKIAKTGKWGPPRKRPDQEILALRRTGLSVRQIAKRVGISPTGVMRALKAVPGTASK
jgi:DNA invertase Pin-like site-specific DNA recombinase